MRVCKKWELERSKTLYGHDAQRMAESRTSKIFWDSVIQRNEGLENNRPDLEMVNNVLHICHIVSPPPL